MRAAVLTAPDGPEAIRIAEVERPSPADDEVLVKVAACGVCGHDQADRMGLTKVPQPVILGHEVAGTVEKAGADVQRLSTGDRVAGKQFSHCGSCVDCYGGREIDCPSRRFVYGGFAEYIALPESSVLPVPESVSLIEAAVVACAIGTSLQALDRIAHVLPGETVAVTGAAGGLGVHAVQVAAVRGARVIAVTRSAANTRKLEALGAAQVVTTDDSHWWRRLLELTDGRGVEVVLDNVGHPAVFSRAFQALARHGRYVFTGQVTADPVRLYPAFVFQKEALVTGSASTVLATFAEALDMVGDGRVRPIVTPYPLSEVVRAFADYDLRRVTGRILLVP